MDRSSGIHGPISKTAAMIGCMMRGMTRTLAIAAAAALAALSAASADAGGARACLNKAEQRAAISHGQAVTLSTAIRSARGSVRGRGAREVVRARLCREPDGLVYLLTLLARDGKVTHAVVDAGSGKVVDAR
jgi:uncharacterized membrane protein YkoI